MTRKLILDVDTGTDDAVAIMLAALHPELELIGVTTVNGNVEVRYCTDNSLRTLDFGMLAGRRESFSAAPLLMNIGRMMLRATGSAMSLPKYFDSTRKAASMGSCVPSNTAERMAIGAG